MAQVPLSVGEVSHNVRQHDQGLEVVLHDLISLTNTNPVLFTWASSKQTINNPENPSFDL